MRDNRISRRDFVTGLGAGAGLSVLTRNPVQAASSAAQTDPFRYCLNTSTIRGQKLGIVKEIDVAAEAGYDAIEPWIASIQEYVGAGGALDDLRKRLEDRGLAVESAISFPQWVVDDDAIRAKAIEQVKREMDMLRRIGGKRLAAPPAGATNEPGLDLMKAAERYRVLLETGGSIGVVPQLELWGFSRNLHRLGQCMFVVVESAHPQACLLADAYHIYKGGSDFNGLKTIAGRALQVFHLNDYPTDPPRERIGDGDRVMPGDGIAPLAQILKDLSEKGTQTVLSLELFSQAYWRRDALEVAKEGLAKMKAAVRRALAV
ncbi:MAG: sugar phosphate isomerase/epimerase [Sedimentisphaerales bacterium]|nr:sugar phosphate isomerase/epimerase [Sedimentisphaerales bacterium]